MKIIKIILLLPIRVPVAVIIIILYLLIFIFDELSIILSLISQFIEGHTP